MRRVLDAFSVFQPIVIGMLMMVVVMLLTQGCSSTGSSPGGTRDFVTTATTTAGGAYIGAKEGDGKGANAAIGAAAGFVVGEMVNYLNNKSQKEAFVAGYEKGQSNAVKQQYWIARANQRPAADDGYEETYYEIDVPQSDRNGVRREPTKRVIRVVAPREDSGS